MTRVLVVEDEIALGRALAINLRAHGYVVDAVADGASALVAAARRPPDVVVLDLGLPDLDGVEVVEGLRGWSSVPIVVLSARHDRGQKVAALDAGADDYVTKPFDLVELLARVRAAVRRGTPSDGAVARLETASFTIDFAAHTVRAGDHEVRLTPNEWHVLEVLARHPGRLVTQRELLQQVWGPHYGSESNYLRVYVSQLRGKLEPDPSHPRHLITEPGVGYRLEP